GARGRGGGGAAPPPPGPPRGGAPPAPPPPASCWRRSASSSGPAPSVEALIAADLAFHRGIAHWSGNAVLCALLDGLSGPATRARIWRALALEGAAGRIVDEHRAILGALRDGDAEAARSRATVHIAGAERWLRSAPGPPREPNGRRGGGR
ncbi:FadR/GntR family transcriptional regulator, partial [Streptomyces sp. NPDC058953]|uniref:FadR/GntR family transcriptional regulator n=1 Tax=Streptomyces sp. NPDC058953 TaxID=3346676 RepID=UPI0036C90724